MTGVQTCALPICRAAGNSVLLLRAGDADGYTHLRRRVLERWDEAWRTAGEPAPAPPIVDQHVALAAPEDVAAFLAASEAWLALSRQLTRSLRMRLPTQPSSSGP